jgi:hypothetical protein
MGNEPPRERGGGGESEQGERLYWEARPSLGNGVADFVDTYEPLRAPVCERADAGYGELQQEHRDEEHDQRTHRPPYCVGEEAHRRTKRSTRGGPGTKVPCPVYIEAMKKLALIALLALALPASSFAKGPSKALIAGPGLTTIRISGAEGSSTPFWRLTQAAGWFEAAYGPSRLAKQPPSDELGRRYTIVWTVPSSGNLRQDVYPYAQPTPVTYMALGQKIYGTPVKGGWFVGGAKLRRALVRVGVPAQAPEAPLRPTPEPARPASSSGLSPGKIAATFAATVILVLALLFGVRARRRPRAVGG